MSVKVIFFNKLKEMSKGKILYKHRGVFAKSENDFSRNLDRVNFSELKDCTNFHSIICSKKRDYISKVKIISSNKCAKCTPLSNFKQDKTYRLLVGDPYEVTSTVRGIYKSEYSSYLVLQTEEGNFLLCLVLNNRVQYLQILE